MKSEKPLVEIKGFGGALGLLIDHTCTFDQIEDELIKLLQRPNSKHFFQGAEIFLQGNGRQLTSDEFARLETLLKREGDLHLKTGPPEELATHHEVNSSSPEFLQTGLSSPEEYLGTDWFPQTLPSESEQHQETPQTLLPSMIDSSYMAQTSASNLATSSDTEKASEKETSLEQIDRLLDPPFAIRGLKTADALLVRQTLHSGQGIRSESSVILMGDLNAGAEIVSEQDVIVLGSLRGMVHAGVSGNRKALVFALRMQPTQIRIAELITQPSPEDKKTQQVEPEIAFVEEDFIIIETCRKIRV